MEEQDPNLTTRGKREHRRLQVLPRLDPARGYSRFLVRFPKTTFLCTGCVPVFLLFLLIGLLIAGTFTLNTDPLLIDRDDRAYKSNQAYNTITRQSINEIDNEPRPNSRPVLSMEIIFHSENGPQVFTHENIRRMRKVEQHILHTDDYTKYCYRGVDSSDCEDPISVLNYFYPEVLSTGEVIYNGKGENMALDTRAILQKMREGEGVFEFANLFVSDDFDDDLESSITRIIFQFGVPFDNKNIQDDDEYQDMTDDIEEYQQDLEDYLRDASTDDMRVLYRGYAFAFSEVLRYLYRDLGLSLVSIFLVFCFLCYQTGSWWLGFFGIFQIIFAFPCAVLTYYYIFRIPFFGFFHLLGVFIVIGIGADDTFIFVDTFKASRRIKEKLEDRMCWTLKRAGRAMLVTSITTIAALILTAILTPFASLQTFGLFTATLVLWDYILVMVFFPSVVVLYAKWFEYRTVLCCFPNSLCPSKCSPVDQEAAGSWRNKNEFTRCLTCQSADWDIIERREGDDSDTESTKDEAPHLRFGTRLLLDFYELFMFHKWRRFLVLLYFALFLALIIVGAAFTQPADDPITFLGDGTNLNDADEYASDFAQNEDQDFLRVVLYWGVDKLDTKGIDRYDEEDTGTVRYDRNFDPTTLEAQEFVLEVCNSAANADGDMKIIPRSDGDQGNVRCYQEEFLRWVQQERPNQPLPVAGYTYEVLLREFVNDKNNFNRFNDYIGFIDNRLAFVAVAFNTSQDTDDNYNKGFDHRDAWWDYVDDLNDGAPNGMTSAKAACGQWSWWHVQQILFQQALLGILISLLVAFGCILLFTLNVIVSLCAILAVASVVATILCLLVVFGWNLGVTEAITVIMVVGLSVDYSVHLSHAYCESDKKHRWSRCRDAIKAVGISVFSGAVTTILAALVLTGAVVIFLQRFGILIICTIFFSLFWSLGLLMVLLAVVGPQGRVGDLSVLLKPIFRRCAQGVDRALLRLGSVFGLNLHS